MTLLTRELPTRTGGNLLAPTASSRVSSLSSYINHDSIDDPFLDIVLRQFDYELAPAVEAVERGDQIGIAAAPMPAVTAVHNLMASLGLTQRDVLKAAGIRKRTFQDWQRNPDRQPRLSSQADLWALAQSIEVISEHVGDCERWLKADPERVRKLARGEHRDLVQVAAKVYSDDKPSRLMERLGAVGFFDEGESPTPTPRTVGRSITVVPAARAVRRGEGR